MMTLRSRVSRIGSWAIALALLTIFPLATLAQTPGNTNFNRVWTRTDLPVAQLVVERSWVWGPGAFTASCDEPYLESPDGFREIQHFEKSRMEINDPNAAMSDVWFVTQGRLAWEMISGNMQVGDDMFINWGPADVYVAGDPDPGAPTYADLAVLMGLDSAPVGSSIIATLSSGGQVGSDPALAAYGVTSAEFVPETGHAVASVFWEFMTSEGPVVVDGATVHGPLFENPFYGVGLPIAGAHWVQVKVRGIEQDVLVQPFERRVLTYTPGNPDLWRVEAGNVGQHYYLWRYGSIPGSIDDSCRNTTAVTFNVYEPRDGGTWERIATTVTSEVFHPGGVASGVWRAYDGLESSGDWKSAGTLVADHTYGGIGLTKLEASVLQVQGPITGAGEIVAEDFVLGFDPRFGNGAQTVLKGGGSMSYNAGGEQGDVEFEVVGTSATQFHVFLNGPAPPVFFAGP